MKYQNLVLCDAFLKANRRQRRVLRARKTFIKDALLRQARIVFIYRRAKYHRSLSRNKLREDQLREINFTVNVSRCSCRIFIRRKVF
jgi:hypothetical protein